MTEPTLKPTHWVIIDKVGTVLYKQPERPSPDVQYSKGSLIAAPGELGFSPLAGGV